MSHSDGVSPWRNAKPRKPLSDYKDSPLKSSTEHEGQSPPNSNFKESTRMETSLGASSPSTSIKLGSGLDVSNGASPSFVRGNDVKGSKQKSSVNNSSRTKSSSFTKIKNSSIRTRSNVENSEDELSEDDQPSGRCQYVGNSSRVSNMSGSTLDMTATTSVNTSTTRKRKKSEKSPSVIVESACCPEEPPSKSSSVCHCVSTVLILSILILLYAANQEVTKPALHSVHQSSAEHWTKVKGHVKTDLKTIIPKFPNQTRDRWILISATLKSPLQPSPEYPGVLMLISTPSTRPTLLCLTSQLLTISSKALGQPGIIPPPPADLIFPSILYAGRNVKQELTDSLHSILSTNGVAAVLDVDQLHPDTALTLHAFADNSNAPYRQSILIISLTVDVDEESLENQKVETLAEEKLKSKWLEVLGPDKFFALISRLVVNALVVKGEDEGSLAQTCPEG